MLSREVKQRREAIIDFARGGRPDLVDKAEKEIKVRVILEGLSRGAVDGI